MPNLNSLVGEQIEFMFWYSDEKNGNDKGQGRWHVEEVLCLSGDDVTIKWVGDYENDDDKITMEELKEENWVQPRQHPTQGFLRLA